MNELSVRLVCQYCREPLEFELDGMFAIHNEYHDCVGEMAHTLALVDADGVRPTKDWVSVEVLE